MRGSCLRIKNVSAITMVTSPLRDHCFIAWILDHMTRAAKGLIIRHLSPAVTENLTAPPEGWERLLSIEQERPDGYPAIAFVHMGDTVRA